MQDHLEATLLLGYVLGALCELSRKSKNNVLEASIKNLLDEVSDKINKIYYSNKD